MIAIITGASSGIGREFAYQLDEVGYDELWLIARRADRLVEIKKDLKTTVKILALDLTDPSSYHKLASELRALKPQVGLVINSAGVGFNDYFDKISIDDTDKMLILNTQVPTKMIKLIRPYMINGSSIINVASVAGFSPQPRFATYSATKAYLINLTRALNREYRAYDIHVTALCPNPVATEFGPVHKKGIKKYATEDLKTLVARAIKKANKKDLITTHWSAGLMRLISKIIPHSFIMWVEKILGMY